MIFGGRILLDPIPGPGGASCEGAAVRLESRGTPSSLIGISPRPARLTLLAFLAETGRSPVTFVRQTVLGAVRGTLERVGDGRLAFFGDGSGIVDVPPALAEFRAEPPPRHLAEREPPRVLRLRFAAPHFQNVLPSPGEESELLIDAGDLRYLEIAARLEVDGAVEADIDVNDRLDIHVTSDAPPPLKVIRVRVHDDSARPLPGAAVRVTLADRTQDCTSDGDGFVTFALPPVCAATVKLAWGGAPEAPRFRAEVVADCRARGDGRDVAARLHNLGYPAFDDFELSVKAFQRAYEVDHQPEPFGTSIGGLPSRTRKKLSEIYARECDATPAVQGAS